jgi:hypothetical protein
MEVVGQVKDDAGQGRLDLGTSSCWLEQGCTWGGGLPAAVPEGGAKGIEGGAMGTWSSAPCCRAPWICGEMKGYCPALGA